MPKKEERQEQRREQRQEQRKKERRKARRDRAERANKPRAKNDPRSRSTIRILENSVVFTEGLISTILDLDFFLDKGIDVPVLDVDETVWEYDLKTKILTIALLDNELVQPGGWEIGDTLWRDRAALIQEYEELQSQPTEIPLAQVRNQKSQTIHEHWLSYAREPISGVPIPFQWYLSAIADRCEAFLANPNAAPSNWLHAIFLGYYPPDTSRADFETYATNFLGKYNEHLRRCGVASRQIELHLQRVGAIADKDLIQLYDPTATIS